jgi:DNA-binding transcriptional MerR regulator
MLPLPPRTPSGRRVYASAALRTLSFIRRGRELGFSLDEIRALLRLGSSEKATCREVREIATHHLEDIRAKLSDLKKTRTPTGKDGGPLLRPDRTRLPGVGHPRHPPPSTRPALAVASWAALLETCLSNASG